MHDPPDVNVAGYLDKKDRWVWGMSETNKQAFISKLVIDETET